MTNTEKTDTTIDAAKVVADELGRDHGRAAATWVEFSPESAARCVKLDEDGDPRWDESWGAGNPLSGEMADSMTPDLLLREVRLDPEIVEDVERMEIEDAYEDAYRSEHRFAVLRDAQAYVDSPDA